MNPYRTYYQTLLMRLVVWYVTPKQARRNAKVARKEAKAARSVERLEREDR